MKIGENRERRPENVETDCINVLNEKKVTVLNWHPVNYFERHLAFPSGSLKLNLFPLWACLFSFFIFMGGTHIYELETITKQFKNNSLIIIIVCFFWATQTIESNCALLPNISKVGIR